MAGQKLRQTAVDLAVCLTLTALFSVGCAGTPSPGDGGLMRYAAADVTYTAKFPGTELVCVCARSGTTTVLEITSPERLCGLTVTYDGTSCVLGAGDAAIPLSAGVASGLTDIFDLLARTDGVPSKSADGLETVITFADGAVTVGESGVPVKAVLGEREISIGEWNG